MENFFDEILLQTHCASHVWQGCMACFETDNVTAFEPNVVHELIECYTHGLVSSGTIQIRFSGETVEARRGDMIIYMPGLDLRTVAASPDCRAQCMMVTADFAHDRSALATLCLQRTPPCA